MNTTSTTSAQTCGFAGNPDIYGLGIRIGFYSQALAAWFASFFMASEARTQQTTNRLFMIAIAIVILWYSINPDDTRYAVELWAMCLIASSIKAVSQQRLSRYSSRYVPFSLTQMGFSRALSLAAAIYASWFWWAGVKLFRPTPCGTWIFFFALVDIYGWFETFAKVCCTIIAARCLLDLISFGHYVKLHLRHRGTKSNFVLTMRMIEDATMSKNADPSEGLILSPKGTNTSEASGNFGTLSVANTSQVSLVATSFPRDVLSAETYLKEVFDFSGTRPPSTEAHGGQQLTSAFSSHLSGLRNMITFFWTHPQLRGTWDVLAMHFENTASSSMDMFPLMHRMIELDARGKTPDFRILKVASDAQLSQLPLYTGHAWVVDAAWSIATIAFMVIGIELTIVANGITELNEIFSVGQLIPFVVGIGGLIQVLWRKWRALQREIREEQEVCEPTGYEHALLVYVEWRKPQEARGSSDA